MMREPQGAFNNGANMKVAEVSKHTWFRDLGSLAWMLLR